MTDVPNDEADWAVLRGRYWRERVAVFGGPDDYVGLVRALLEDTTKTLEEAYPVLQEAVGRHPRSVAVWELVVLVTGRTNRGAEMDRALAVLELLDPASRVLSVIDELPPQAGATWARDAGRITWELVQRAASGDPQARTSAADELGRWARAFPNNSTYVVNHALGLYGAGRADEARLAALAAARIEDGSFADAFNIGMVLLRTGDPAATRCCALRCRERPPVRSVGWCPRRSRVGPPGEPPGSLSGAEDDGARRAVPGELARRADRGRRSGIGPGVAAPASAGCRAPRGAGRAAAAAPPGGSRRRALPRRDAGEARNIPAVAGRPGPVRRDQRAAAPGCRSQRLAAGPARAAGTARLARPARDARGRLLARRPGTGWAAARDHAKVTRRNGKVDFEFSLSKKAISDDTVGKVADAVRRAGVQ